MRIGLAISLALGLGACASTKHYDGPVRPASELAVVEKEYGIICNIVLVNGTFAGLMGGPTRVELLPGPQVINVTYANVNSYSAWVPLPFDAVAGHAYQVECLADRNHWQPYLYDKTAKKIVSPPDLIDRLEKASPKP